ncbi:MAG: Uma2 family endonuclease [Thermosynechococcaceae cyanobacterium]
MVQTPVKPITLTDFLSLPETKPASEYVDGRMTQKPMPQGKHSRLQDKLVKVINAAVESEQLACAFPELRCTFDGSSIVPDIAVFTWARIPTDDIGEIANVFPAPDWTIEILSPRQRPTRVTKNILRCLKNDTQMGWLIDPEDRAVFIYRPSQEIEIFDEPEDILPLPSFMGEITFRVADLFGLLFLSSPSQQPLH